MPSFTRQYRELHGQLEVVLYQHDPYVVTGGGSSPEDEYSREATKLIATLAKAEDLAARRRLIRTMFPGASVDLVGDILRAWDVYRRALEAST